MNDTITSIPPVRDGRRTGATWVAATGAFLLLAAAAVFVATRWDRIPEELKLAVLAGITGACVLAGDRLRRTLPATGNALFHLGAFLVPVNLAALNLRLGLEWPELLLLEGIVSTATFALLAARARSVVLGAAASAAVMVTAAAIAATTVLPAPFVLAVASLVLVLAGRKEPHAFVWAIVAGVAPLAVPLVERVAFTDTDAYRGQGVVDGLGLAHVEPWIWPVLTAIAASIVIVRGARRRGEPALALLAVVATVAHFGAAWSVASLPDAADILVLPACFVVIELGALLARRDQFWAQPVHVATSVVECVAAPATFGLLVAGTVLALFDQPADATWATAAGLVALGWFAAGIRREPTARALTASLRSGTDWWATVPGVGAAALAALGFAVPDATVVALAALVVAMLAAAGPHRHALPFTAAAAWYAVALGASVAEASLWIGAAAGVIVAFVAARAGRDRVESATAACLAVGALAVGLLGATDTLDPRVLATVWVVACWAYAALLDARDRTVADGLRVVGLGASFALVGWAPVDMLLPALALVTLAVVDAGRTNRPRVATCAALPAVQVSLALARLADLSFAQSGLALCLAAAVWLGLGTLLDSRWSEPLHAAGGASLFVGVLLAGGDPVTFGPALIVAGGVAIGAGLLHSQPVAAHAGALVLTVGCWITLATQSVTATEAYAAPVAAYLLAAGYSLRERVSASRPGSWVAYGPAVTLLAATALAERLSGGGAAHAVVAGAVGVVAVAVGGWQRLSAPLLIGTATLVVVTIHESLDAAAGVPTWVWLALGGTALIAAAVAMERTDTSPVDAGRRVVDALSEHFE